MRISVLLTAFKESPSIGKAIEKIVAPNHRHWPEMDLIIVAPDDETLAAAQAALKPLGFPNYQLIKDDGKGKPAALNLAITKATGEILVLTDGDMHVDDLALVKLITHFGSENSKMLGGVGGHPVSLEDRSTMFGYFSHLFCEAAHQKRLREPAIAMSGYLYAIRNVPGIFPLPVQIRADDAYITSMLVSMGYTIKYEPEALAYVNFPKNFKDWMKQKTRSLGGNVQLKSFPANSPQISRTRSIMQDIGMALFPLKFARNAKEMFYSLILYFLRAWLWINIYLRHMFGMYSQGAWDRIESSKS